MSLNGVEVLETILRDGFQSRQVRVRNVEDPLTVIKAIDGLGYADIIEAGFAGASVLTDRIIRAVQEANLHARIASFGRTRMPNTDVRDYVRNPGIRNILDSNTPVVVLVYKSWDYQVGKVLGTTLEENLKMIEDSVRFFRAHGREVIADAEFASAAFLGYPQKKIDSNVGYLMETLQTASGAGASKVVLCDTTGILLPEHIPHLINLSRNAVGGNEKLGFHGHNDGEIGVALTYDAIRAGVTHVQTSFLGLGERTGNVNSGSLLGLLTSPYRTERIYFDLSGLKKVSELVHLLLTDKPLPTNMPLVGNSGFAHGGGMHVAAQLKLPFAYNGRDPAEFGNEEHMPLSLQAGTGHIASILGVSKSDPWVRRVYDKSMALLEQGYELDEYPKFFKLVAVRLMDGYVPPFNCTLPSQFLEGKGKGKNSLDILDQVEFTVSVDGKEYLVSGAGNGPVDAVVKGVQDKVAQHYHIPSYDFKYGVASHGGRGSSQTVAVEASFIISNGKNPIIYTMPAISTSVIHASVQAILDGLEYAIMYTNPKFERFRV